MTGATRSVGISCDSVDSNKAFKAKHELPFTLIADSDGATARGFGVPVEHKMLGDKPSLLVDRQMLIIDKDRRIIQQFKPEDPEERVRKTFEALEVPF
ncbi:MAG: redoxin domain-containing protein [Phycisphaerae bacterium]|nr:redoxin domain-containing protein [Phycisphaerae bacterium]